MQVSGVLNIFRTWSEVVEYHTIFLDNKEVLHGIINMYSAKTIDK